MWNRFAARASRTLLALALACWAFWTQDAPAGEIRIGVLKFGTVNWELDVIKARGLDRAEGVTVSILPLASKIATSVALQGRSVDMIVTDWIWVSRQRAEGARFTFVPYSTSVGALMVPAGSGVRTLADLKGKRVGIAGGPLDKSWLLLRGLAAERHGIDLDGVVEKVFGAPPLLNQQILLGRLDAVINFWHYAARLEAAGLRRVMGIDEAASAFGIESAVPLIGYVFDEAWAEGRREDVLAFVRASRAAKAVLAEQDAEWERLRPLMKAPDETTFRVLRDTYRLGIPRAWGAPERADAARMFTLLAKLGGRKLVGPSGALQDGTFWAAVVY